MKRIYVLGAIVLAGALAIAVKDTSTNRHMLGTLARAAGIAHVVGTT